MWIVELLKTNAFSVVVAVGLSWFFLTKVWPDIKEQRQILRDEIKAERGLREQATSDFNSALRRRDDELRQITDIQKERSEHFQATVTALKDLTDEIRDMRRNK